MADEPIAAILAKMRADVADGENAFFIRADWLALCDRIEAAVRSDIAALRIALFRATEELNQVYKHADMTEAARESVGEAIHAGDAILRATPPPPKKFDEAAFDEAVSKPNGWDGVADPVAEIRRMRGDSHPTRNVDRPECRTLTEAWDVFSRESAGMWAADWDAAFSEWLFEPAKDEGASK